ncbi:hypothetical protein [Dactylosporangium sp. NPDC051541]|uniref:hypothetical protein n=1 Tax=Dactylosporangium sp. NPDC051541 TaxID=3363977 RepID=UPI0037BB0E95
MTGGQSQLGQLCEAVRFLGDNTDGLAAALHEHARQLAMTSARMTIAGTGDRTAGHAAAAALDAAARACTRAATQLMSGGKLARDYASANCGGGGPRTVTLGGLAVKAADAADEKLRRETARFAALQHMELQGLDAQTAGFVVPGLQRFPVHVLAGIGSVRFVPERRPKPNWVGATWFRPGLPPRIELYGSPDGHPAGDERRLLRRTLVHEVAHVVYGKHLTKDEQAEWESLCARTYAAGQHPMNEYAATHPREEFSETAVALLYDDERPEGLSPERLAFVEQHLGRLEAEELALVKDLPW